MDKEIYTPYGILESFRGKKMILAGNACRQKQNFQENLAYIGGSLNEGFAVSANLREADGKSYVILFAAPERMEDLDDLLGQLKQTAGMKPAAAALISDNRVYGKLFGTLHCLKENEIGYASHVMPEDIPVTNLRTAEHFACRLAREEGLNIRVLRAEAAQSGESTERMIEAAAQLLLQGAPGAVYNLPMPGQCHGEHTSPLSPIPVITEPGTL